MSGRTTRADFLRSGRRGQILRELVHDPYTAKRKLNEPDACANVVQNLGEALQHAYHGTPDYRYAEAQSMLRVGWIS